jgi:hypothetical protein
MRPTNYRRESPGKKQARLLLWHLVETTMGRSKFLKGPFLVLASAEAGDVSTLLGMGVPPNVIYAVDVDRHAIAAAKAKYKAFPGVNWADIDFVLAAEYFRIEEWAFAFIDLCSNLHPNDVDLNNVVALKARHKAYEFMVAREKGLPGSYIKAVGKADDESIKPRMKYINSRGFKSAFSISYNSSTEVSPRGTTMCIALSKSLTPMNPTTSAVVSFDHKALHKEFVKSTNPNTWLLYNVRKSAVAGVKSGHTKRLNEKKGIPPARPRSMRGKKKKKRQRR